MKAENVKAPDISSTRAAPTISHVSTMKRRRKAAQQKIYETRRDQGQRIASVEVFTDAAAAKLMREGLLSADEARDDSKVDLELGKVLALWFDA
jgi:hypothetical protein